MIKIVYSKQKGNTIVAKKQIPKGTPVLIYHGKIVDQAEMTQIYLNSPSSYISQISPYLRASNKPEKVVNGKIIIDKIKSGEKVDLKHLGVLVNDYQKLESVKDISKYMKSQEHCNLIVDNESNSEGFPVYVTKRKIKKGEELTVHYGIAYWLLQIGIPPERLSEFIPK